MTIDLALTEDDAKPGELIAHRPDCPVVERHRETGRIVVTMLDCKGLFPANLKRCACLSERRPSASAANS